MDIISSLLYFRHLSSDFRYYVLYIRCLIVLKYLSCFDHLCSINNWGIEVTKRDPNTQKPICNADGSYQKEKIRMEDAQFADGIPQPLYFPEGHAHAGVFKGMVTILEEWGFQNMAQIRVECKGFKCPPGATSCCCRRILYNQYDFTNVTSILELTCKALGSPMLPQSLSLPAKHWESW